MSNQKKIIKKLRQEASRMEIPQGLQPENMRSKLEYMEACKEIEQPKGISNSGTQRSKKIHKFPIRQMGAAACFVLLLLGGLAMSHMGKRQQEIDHGPIDQTSIEQALIDQTLIGQTFIDQTLNEQTEVTSIPKGFLMEGEEETQAEENVYPDITYEEIYATMLPTWEEQGWFLAEADINVGVLDFAEVAFSEETVRSESSPSKQMAYGMNTVTDLAGTTNVQTAGVDEGDLVKNDGRYLFQNIRIQADEGIEYAVQIVDTRDGLKEIARVPGFDSIQEFYVTDGLLIVIENKYRQDPIYRQDQSAMKSVCCYEVLYENYYHEITVFDLSNPAAPQKCKTFTLDGRYESSRVADGYFYGFSRYYATPGEGETDYDAYVPRIDGAALEAGKILFPEGSKGTSYLVLISVNLKEPDKIFRSTAVVSQGNLYYVSGKNIYVTYPKTAEGEEGWNSDKTAVLRFAYGAGKFKLEAEGEIKGSLENSFSLDEHNGYLRAVSTVREYRLKKLVDDRTGMEIGSSVEENRQTNALYVLNAQLETVGAIEGLAEDEQIYSARFLGDTGYFVTFRQTDPLFAVDLTNPEAPRILSELKISGFSEYLHFYGEDRLLGIGMEADENTGAQKGLKLSMFDISDPGNVTEVSKLWLDEYNYSEALYNHRAILISTGANLFGFEAEGSGKGRYWKDYLLFSYEDEQFVTRLSLDTKTDEGYYQSRGTFIGDVFYLLKQDGSVQSYNWKTGQKLESLTIAD